MKITKGRIRQIIAEEIAALEEEEQESKMTSRVAKAQAATAQGGTMNAEEYKQLVMSALGTDKATPQIKVAALDDIFPGMGNRLVKMMMADK